jgi:hypothetical protein
MSDEDKNIIEKKAFDVLNVPIFKAGHWNGAPVTENDLDEIVKSFAEIGGVIKPYLKLGHDKGQKLLQENGYPAAGWITNVKKVGDEILADFRQVPEKIKGLIDKRAYGRFSSEIYHNLKSGEKVYPRVLKAVALLGGDSPAVNTLDDFIDLYHETEFDAELIVYDKFEVTHMADENKDLEMRIKEYELAIVEKDAKYSELEKAHGELSAELEQVRKEGRQKEVNDFISAAVSEGKIVPAQVECYTALSMGENGFDMVKKIVESMPKIVEFEEKSKASGTSEKTYSNTQPEDPEEKLEADIKKYMDENKVSYRDAYKAIASKES